MHTLHSKMNWRESTKTAFSTRRLENSPKIYIVTQSHQEIWNTSLPFGMFKYLERKGQQNLF